jgi:predicted ATPase
MLNNMKITRFQASKVHGYLPIDVSFYDELTFLVGLNGSGKTSALRLIMALLTPSIEELGSISFENASVTIEEDGMTVIVSAEKTSEGVVISISNTPEKLQLTSADLELYMGAQRREEHRSPIIDKFLGNLIYQKIKSIAKPMFLGIDRRFYASAVGDGEMGDVRRREYISRRYYLDDPAGRGNPVAALSEVNYLVITRMQEVRASQEVLDERLRAQFFTKAFEYKPSNLLGSQKPMPMPSSAEMNKYRQQLAKIERAAEGLKIPFPDIQNALTHFLERMGKVVESLGEMSQQIKKAAVGKKSTKKKMVQEEFIRDNVFVDWIVNRPQADRIVEHLRLLDDYIEKRSELRGPINRFLSLINEFLRQTGKEITVDGNGHLAVSINGVEGAKSISALSSGERQLLVMLAHLSLNQSLVGSGVFIVDEPEISLHIDWQEKFVDSVREANPKVQLILATHSPAIILDRSDYCRSLNLR